MKNSLSKWLAALVAVCMFLTAPMALMEETGFVLEPQVGEVNLELGLNEEQLLEQANALTDIVEYEALEAMVLDGDTWEDDETRVDDADGYPDEDDDDESWDDDDDGESWDDDDDVDSSDDDDDVDSSDDDDDVDSSDDDDDGDSWDDDDDDDSWDDDDYDDDEDDYERSADGNPIVRVELYETGDFDLNRFFKLEEGEAFQSKQITSSYYKANCGPDGYFHVEGKKEGQGLFRLNTTKGRELIVEIVVIDSYAPTAVILNGGKSTKIASGKSANVPYTLEPSDARHNLTWTSSVPEVATMEGRKLHANRPGTTIITATSYNGVTGKLKVTVTGNAEGLPEGVSINTTNFPNEYLRNYIEANFDGDYNGVLDKSELAKATVIELDDGDIHAPTVEMNNAKGIELLPNLIHLDVCYCNLSRLDVSKNPKLEVLCCEGNTKLVGVDISNCPHLIEAYKGNREEREELGYIYLRYTSGDYKLTVSPELKIKTSGSSTGKITVKLSANGEKSIKLSKKKVQLKAAVSPASANQTVTWTSSNTKAATVNKNGLVTLKGAGKTVITATAADGKAKDTLTLTVKDDVTPAEKITVKLSVNGKKSIKLSKKKVQLKATVSPASANQTVTWASSNTKAATVNKNGLVTLKGEGKTTITATAASGKARDTLILTVKDDMTPKSVSIVYSGSSSVKLSKGKITLKAVVSPSTADQKVKWKAEPSDVASVKSGVLTLKKAGKVTVTVATSNKLTKTLKLTIVDDTAPKSIVIASNKGFVMDVRDTMKLKATVEPSTAVQSVKWSFSPSGIISMNKTTGAIKAKKTGKVKVKATSTKDSSVYAIVEIEIVDKRAPAAVAIRQGSKATVKVNGKLQLTTKLKPSTNNVTPETTFTWSSNKSSIASVNKTTGLVTGRKPGIAVITVKTANGKMDKISIKVK